MYSSLSVWTALSSEPLSAKAVDWEWLAAWAWVKANWPSVWSWCRRITEIILDNIQFDVLPQRWLEGFCFMFFFSRPGLKIHGCTWLFAPILCFSNILAQPKPPQQETKLEKDCIQSLEENLCNFQENHLSVGIMNWEDGVFFRSGFPKVSIMWFNFQSVLKQHIL